MANHPWGPSLSIKVMKTTAMLIADNDIGNVDNAMMRALVLSLGRGITIGRFTLLEDSHYWKFQPKRH